MKPVKFKITKFRVWLFLSGVYFIIYYLSCYLIPWIKNDPSYGNSVMNTFKVSDTNNILKATESVETEIAAFRFVVNYGLCGRKPKKEEFDNKIQRYKIVAKQFEESYIALMFKNKKGLGLKFNDNDDIYFVQKYNYCPSGNSKSGTFIYFKNSRSTMESCEFQYLSKVLENTDYEMKKPAEVAKTRRKRDINIYVNRNNINENTTVAATTKATTTATTAYAPINKKVEFKGIESRITFTMKNCKTHKIEPLFQMAHPFAYYNLYSCHINNGNCTNSQNDESKKVIFSSDSSDLFKDNNPLFTTDEYLKYMLTIQSAKTKFIFRTCLFNFKNFFKTILLNSKYFELQVKVNDGYMPDQTLSVLCEDEERSGLLIINESSKLNDSKLTETHLIYDITTFKTFKVDKNKYCNIISKYSDTEYMILHKIKVTMPESLFKESFLTLLKFKTFDFKIAENKIAYNYDEITILTDYNYVRYFIVTIIISLFLLLTLISKRIITNCLEKKDKRSFHKFLKKQDPALYAKCKTDRIQLKEAKLKEKQEKEKKTEIELKEEKSKIPVVFQQGVFYDEVL